MEKRKTLKTAWAPTLAIVAACSVVALVLSYLSARADQERQYREGLALWRAAAQSEREHKRVEDLRGKAVSARDEFTRTMTSSRAIPEIIAELDLAPSDQTQLNVVVRASFLAENRSVQREFGKVLTLGWRGSLAKHVPDAHGSLWLFTQSGTLLGRSFGDDFHLEEPE